MIKYKPIIESILWIFCLVIIQTSTEKVVVNNRLFLTIAFGVFLIISIIEIVMMYKRK